MDTRLCVLLFVLACVAALDARRIVKRASSKCFDDLGCFSNGGDFFHPIYRPIDLLPQARELIDVRFRIYTPQYKKDHKELRSFNVKNFNNAEFNLNPKLETKIIVHGYIDNQFFGKWMRDMKDEFLLREDYNVIIVDWSGGNKLPYIQASANTRLVGAEIAFLVNTLKNVSGFDPQKVHLLGHSLGGQIVGYAGERIPKLGRITSFDPAEPYFQYMPPSVRIDPTDAEFVEVVHTDSKSILLLGLGMSQLAGHVDFFPNNGVEQPGCLRDRFVKIFTDGLPEGMRQIVACNHQRAVDYVEETINSARCQMVGYACNDWKTFLDGQCASCGKKGDQCALMGINSDTYKVFKNDTRQLKLFLKTNDKPPYCLFHYQVTMKLQNNRDSDRSGDLFLTLNGESGSEEIQLGKKSLYQGAQYTFLATTPKHVGSLKSISFRWKSSQWSIFGTHKITLQSIKVVPMNDVSPSRDNAVREYCSTSGYQVESGKSVTFSSPSKC